MFTSLWMSGTHGEHNTTPKRLSTRAMKLDKNLSCALRLTCIQTTKNPRIESHLKLSRTQHVRNNVHSTSIAQPLFAKPAVSATFTHNQLTQGSIRIPLQYHVVITFQKNQSGPNSVSLSTVCFDNSPGTTCSPQRVQPCHRQYFRSQVSLVSLRSNRLDLLSSREQPLATMVFFTASALTFPSPALCAMRRAATESQKREMLALNPKCSRIVPRCNSSSAVENIA